MVAEKITVTPAFATDKRVNFMRTTSVVVNGGTTVTRTFHSSEKNAETGIRPLSKPYVRSYPFIRE